MMCGAAVGWAARLQRCSSLSSAEAEFYALSEAVAETVHFRNLLAEIGVVLDSPTVIYCDSRGARLKGEGDYLFTGETNSWLPPSDKSAPKPASTKKH